MTPNWKDLETFDDWADALRSLMDVARAALKAGDAGARARIKKDLIAFVDRSPDWIVKELDSLAGEVIKALGKAAIDDAISDIESRTVDLARLTKAIEAGTAANLQEARRIRLERARKTVDSITQTVGSLSDLKASLESGAKDDAIRTDIETLIESLQSLRNTVENG